MKYDIVKAQSGLAFFNFYTMVNLMPFTPFHMGPGILIKAVLQGSFSLLVFGWSQIVMDLQPLFAIGTGIGKLHGFTHTYVGSTLIAIFSAVTGKYLSQWGLSVISYSVRRGISIRWWVAFLSAFIGSYSHVVLDSMLYNDIEPFFPFSRSNELLGLISVSTLHRFCVYSGFIGAAAYFVLSYLLSNHKSALKTDVQNRRAD